jgi:hypothetical protein
MNRSYELEPVDGGWKLRLLEDGEEVGGGRGGDDDYNDLMEAAEQFVGIESESVRP